MEANRLSYYEPPPKVERTGKVLHMPVAELATKKTPTVTETPVPLRDRLIKLINSVLMD